MDVQLPPELEPFVQSEIQSGRYSSATEVVRDALRLLEEGSRLPDLQPDEIRQKIAEGAEALRRGEAVDGEEAFGRLEAKLGAMEHERKAG